MPRGFVLPAPDVVLLQRQNTSYALASAQNQAAEAPRVAVRTKPRTKLRLGHQAEPFTLVDEY